MKKIAPFLLGLPLGFQLFACNSTGLKTDKSTIGILANPQELLADGVAVSTLTIKATAADGLSAYTGNAMLSSGVPVSFGTSKTNTEELLITAGAATETVSCDGKLSSNCYGPVVIYGYLQSNGAGQSGQVTVTFDAPDAGPVDAGVDAGTDAGPKDAGPGVDAGPDAGPLFPSTIAWVGNTNPFLGVDYKAPYTKFSTNTFKFVVLDTVRDAGVPGIQVDFTTPSGNAPETTLVNNPPFAVTDSAGIVGALISSGTKEGPVTVIATFSYDGGPTHSADGFSNVVGTQPSVTNSGMFCGPVNLPVYAVGNLPCGNSSTQNLQTKCTVKLADRFSNAIGVKVVVQFFSEAGNWQNQSVDTPAYGAAPPPGPGTAENFLQTTSRLPVNVPPNPLWGEDLFAYTSTCAGTPWQFNPRDGLNTVIAVFTGEEPLTASDYWSPGQPFVDLPQPFVDRTDSSSWQPGDPCAGTADGGVCDGPNGQWDGAGNVWVEARLMYTSEPDGRNFIWSGPFTIPNAGSTVGSVTMGDINSNLPTSASTYNVSLLSGPSAIQVAWPAPGHGAAAPDNLGLVVTRLTECDAGFAYLQDGGSVPNPICSYRTVVDSYSGGFTGYYKLSQSASADGGAVCLQAAGALPPGGADTSSQCGIAL